MKKSDMRQLAKRNCSRMFEQRTLFFTLSKEFLCSFELAVKKSRDTVSRKFHFFLRRGFAFLSPFNLGEIGSLESVTFDLDHLFTRVTLYKPDRKEKIMEKESI